MKGIGRTINLMVEEGKYQLMEMCMKDSLKTLNSMELENICIKMGICTIDLKMNHSKMNN
jgi:hypothetical protein